MPISSLQKQTAQAIVNVFETGEVQGDYGKVTLLRGDPGHLTYGRSQTTLASGNLYLLIKAYCEEPEAAAGSRLAPYLDRLAACDLALDGDKELRDVLASAGEDPVMQAVQDDFFDRVYWMPAVRSAEYIGVAAALSHAVVYDGRLHGSWHALRDRTEAAHGKAADIGETDWIARYVEVRREWLATHAKPILRRTVYRMDAFRRLIADGNWDLDVPVVVRGVRIDEDSLGGTEPVRASAEEAPSRLLRLATPRLEGDDVRRLQRALAAHRPGLVVDGVFGPATEAAVLDYQEDNGLKVDGIVGPATLARLAP